MKRTFDAAEHDKWLRGHVEDAVIKADMPDAVWIPHEEVVNDMQQQRAAIKAEFARMKR